MTSKPLDELWKDLEAVAMRLYSERESDEEYLERLAEHINNMPNKDEIRRMMAGTDEQWKQLEAVAVRLCSETDSEEEFLERFDEYIDNLPHDEGLAFTRMMAGNVLFRRIKRRLN